MMLLLPTGPSARLIVLLVHEHRRHQFPPPCRPHSHCSTAPANVGIDLKPQRSWPRRRCFVRAIAADKPASRPSFSAVSVKQPDARMGHHILAAREYFTRG